MWACRFCHVKHTCVQTHCESCNRHWKQAQAVVSNRSQSRRSRRSQRSNPERKRATEPQVTQETTKEGSTSVPEEAIFTTKHPWVANSPHARAPAVEDKPATAEEAQSAMPIPPEPKIVTTANGDEDVIKLHQHLKALKAALGTLPEELEEKLAQCEDKAREKALSHGHLNRLGKVNKQMKAIAGKLQAMDEGWQKFAKQVMAKFEEHRQMYHTSTEALVKEYLSKAQELQAAKEEVQLASQHLFAEQPAAPALPHQEDTAAMFAQALQDDELFQQAQFDGYTGAIETIEDEEDELMADPLQGKPKDARAPFARRVGSSPTKVTNLHLKPKDAEKLKSPATPNK